MWLLDLIARWLGRASLLLFPRATVHGIKTIISDIKAPRTVCLERLSASINTLQDVDGRRRGWLTRYARYIVIWPGPYSFADSFGGIFIASDYLLEAEPERVAGVLVHEAVHHRLKRFRIKTTPQLKPRIETICTEEQADFLRKCGERGRAWAKELEDALMDPWWSEIHEHVRIEELIERGMPRSIGWLMKRRLESAP